jgi:signal transduction histidine kinase
MDSKHEFENEIKSLREQIVQLQTENKELSSNLFRVNEKLRDSEQLKGHFISNITNEIVNPFASILAVAENLKKLNSIDLKMVHHLADLIYEDAFHLDFQLKNIFAVALIEAGKEKINYSKVNLNDFGAHLSEYFHNLLGKKNISLSVQIKNNGIANGSVISIIDREKTDLILKNLISNSIKFSPDGSVINLVISLEGGHLLIEVSDHGKGIATTDQQIVFDRFKQLDEKINSINTGHGLGLSIVQAYTEMLDGQISLSNNPDGGIRFRISLPERSDADNLDNLEDFLLDTEVSF